MDTAATLVARLGLTPHPEGGWYREIHRAQEQVMTARGVRSALTTIYYLLERHQLSRWHVVSADEIWHFYAGDPLELLIYDPTQRELRRNVLGPPAEDREPIGVVRANIWQAARSLGAYSLVGCNVGPGFDFADFRFVSSVPGHREHFVGAFGSYAAML
jgi:predicted cupin superfamily sugar epimerase